MRLTLLILLVLSTLCLAPHAVADEKPPSRSDEADALLDDLERIVGAQSADWRYDEAEHADMYPAVLDTVCRTPVEARHEALAALGQRVKQGGDPGWLYERDGEVSSAVADALAAQRQHRALREASDRAARDCPFWMPVDARYRGRQTNRDRVTWNAETGGIVQLRRTEGRWTFGGGGAGRVMPGFGFGGHLTLLAGLEFGGGAMLRPNTSPNEFIINYLPAVPVVLRIRNVSWHYDLEVAPVALFQADNVGVSWGARVGGGIGVSALRTRNFIPWAGIAAAYEHYVPSGGRDRAHLLRGGFRVGVRWDP